MGLGDRRLLFLKDFLHLTRCQVALLHHDVAERPVGSALFLVERLRADAEIYLFLSGKALFDDDATEKKSFPAHVGGGINAFETFALKTEEEIDLVLRHEAAIQHDLAERDQLSGHGLGGDAFGQLLRRDDLVGDGDLAEQDVVRASHDDSGPPGG